MVGTPPGLWAGRCHVGTWARLPGQKELGDDAALCESKSPFEG